MTKRFTVNAPVIYVPRIPVGTYRIYAVESDGVSASTTYNVTEGPANTSPSPPSAVSAVANTGQATVSWTMSANDGGSPITFYAVASSPGSQTCTTFLDSCTVTGLNNGDIYTFTVTATNAIGTSAPSTPSGSVTP